MLSLRISDFLETKLIDLCKEEKKTKTKIIQESLLLYIESIVAFFDEGDRYSKAFRNYFKTFQGKLFTTLAVITEASYLLDENKNRQLDFIEWIKDGAISIIDISGDDFGLIHKYMKKYSDTPMDFADASLVILAHKLSTKTILTLDNDFSVYRTIDGKKFDHLLKSILH